MSSFQTTVSPSRRAAARYVSDVRKKIQKALIQKSAETGITQSAIARALGVHRSVINRELRGQKDMTLGRVAELAWALGREPHFELLRPPTPTSNHVTTTITFATTSSDTPSVSPQQGIAFTAKASAK